VEWLVAAHEVSSACLPRRAPRTWCDQPPQALPFQLPPSSRSVGRDVSVLVWFYRHGSISRFVGDPCWLCIKPSCGAVRPKEFGFARAQRTQLMFRL